MDYQSNFGITDKRWHNLRRYILARDNYLDQEALRFGKRVEADHVHHIFPREYFPEWRYEPWNLISLSLSNHNKMHDRSSRKLSNEGWNLLVRTARKNGIEINECWKSTLVGNE